MFDQIKILWIDEDTNSALTEIKSRLDNSINFRLQIKETLEAAKEIIETLNQYDIIIVDIRIPRNNLEKIQNNSRFDKNGLELIRVIFLENITHKLLIFTNESIEGTRTSLPGHTITNDIFLQKTSDITTDDFIEKIKLIHNTNKI